MSTTENDIATKLVAIAENQQKVYVAGAYAAGQLSEYDRFWDSFQQNGERRQYKSAFFGGGWNDETFKPKYNITLGASGNTATHIFGSSNIENFKEILEKQGVYFDASAFTGSNGQSFFVDSKIRHCGRVIWPEKAHFAGVFSGCANLITVDSLDLNENGTQQFSGTFDNCTSLENLTITGKIGNNGFDVHWSTKLSHDSIMSIIHALKEKTSGTWKVTLPKDGKEKLSASEVELATEKGWTLVWL